MLQSGKAYTRYRDELKIGEDNAENGPHDDIINVRLDKRFKVGRNSAKVFLEVKNLFNRRSVRRFDYDLVKDVPAYAGEAVEADEMWERLEYFLTRIVPVAEEAGVRLALHPHDPPTPYLRGEARILNSFEGMKRLVELVPSEVNGLNFCQGTVAEMGIDVIGAIRYFGERDKLNHVHFRNVKGSVPRFDESFVDDGDTDMLEAVRAYHEVGYRYAMMPDHTPHIAGDSPYGHRGRAYAIGYMRALMQAVGAVES